VGRIQKSDSEIFQRIFFFLIVKSGWKEHGKDLRIMTRFFFGGGGDRSLLFMMCVIE